MNPKAPHLVPAACAIALVIGLLFGFNNYAQITEYRSIHALALELPPQTNLGIALQRAAFQYPDLLIVYGSSEMSDPAPKYGAVEFFQSHAAGFTVVDVANPGVTSLFIALNLAADGTDLGGKPVVISFTPSMFEYPEVGNLPYSNNFSQLHAEEFV